MKNVAILVFACDRYELLFQGFDFFLNKYWDQSLPLKKYFATEENDFHLQGYTPLKSGKGEWTNRLKRVLDQIEEEYIIFIQEDMWFEKKMEANVLQLILKYTMDNNLNLVKLHSSEVYKAVQTDVDFDGYVLAKINTKTSDFLMSHQVSIWKKSFLYEQLKDGEHPWRNERRGTKRLRKMKAPIYQVDLLSENGKHPINQNDSKVNQGGYQTISMNACIHPKAMKFVKELEDKYPAYAKQIRKHIEEGITHDGKPKPRKEDVFMKIKRLLKS